MYLLRPESALLRLMLAMSDNSGGVGVNNSNGGKAKKPRKRYDILKTASCTVCGKALLCKRYFSKGTVIPHICHGRHGRRPCKFFLAGVNFYRFKAKNWHFRKILREQVAFFLQI